MLFLWFIYVYFLGSIIFCFAYSVIFVLLIDWYTVSFDFNVLIKLPHSA